MIDKTQLEVDEFQLDLNQQKPLFRRKRLWCSLRDYLKSPEFNDYFVASLENEKTDDANKWKRDNPELRKSLYVLELPGDVWNNAQVFRSGLFSPYLKNERKSWDMPKTIREIYKQLREIYKQLVVNGQVAFYPEQLDVSFYFVPRMCEENMCGVCMFGKGVDKVCHKKSGILCSVALIACGYKHICEPTKCVLKENRVSGLCKSSLVPT